MVNAPVSGFPILKKKYIDMVPAFKGDRELFTRFN